MRSAVTEGAHKRVLLTVSGTISPDVHDAVAAGRRPRVDYIEMAQAFGADLIDYAEANDRHGAFGRVVERLLGRNAGLAWECFRARRSYSVVVTDGEQVGLPYAALMSFTSRRRNPRHIMIVHILSVTKKLVMFRVLRLGRKIDEMIVYARAQRDVVVKRLGFPGEHVTLSNFMVDTEFFSPSNAASPPDGPAPSRRRLICSAGLEYRDYPTLMEAVRDLDVEVVVAAASPWSRRKSELDGRELPSNVEVVRLNLAELRDLYARASIVVLPLRESDFQGGVTTLLEAMSMEKPVICSRTTGQTDVVIEGESGHYVPVGDAAALRTAITALLEAPVRASAMGAAARHWVLEHADIDVYVEALRRRVAHHL